MCSIWRRRCYACSRIFPISRSASPIRKKDGGVELICVSGRAPVNPLKEGVAKDEFGIKLIKARCRQVEYRYENGKNILVLKIRGE